MDKLKKILFKPIVIGLGLLAVLPVTPIAFCLLYGWIES
jgi:hypothetical protein